VVYINSRCSKYIFKLRSVWCSGDAQASDVFLILSFDPTFKLLSGIGGLFILWWFLLLQCPITCMCSYFTSWCGQVFSGSSKYGGSQSHITDDVCVLLWNCRNKEEENQVTCSTAQLMDYNVKLVILMDA